MLLCCIEWLIVHFDLALFAHEYLYRMRSESTNLVNVNEVWQKSWVSKSIGGCRNVDVSLSFDVSSILTNFKLLQPIKITIKTHTQREEFGVELEIIERQLNDRISDRWHKKPQSIWPLKVKEIKSQQNPKPKVREWNKRCWMT